MSIGIWQVVLILLIVLIIFGAGKLPNVMGDLAKGIRNFKKGLSEGEEEQAEEKPKAVTAETPKEGKEAVVQARTAEDQPAKS